MLEGEQMNRDKIIVKMSGNERGSGRDTSLALAISEDPRFLLPTFSSEILCDLEFSLDDKKLLVELKACSDYVASVFGREGHMFCQCLDGLSMILVLGGDNQVADAIYQSLKTRYHGDELKYELESHKKRLWDFEAQCYGLHIPVMRWQFDPFHRLLSTAHKVLTGASLHQYAPRPMDGERDLIACSLLFRGIGTKTLEPIMQQYRLALIPRGEYAKPIEEFKGVGKVRLEQINKRVVMYYGANR